MKKLNLFIMGLSTVVLIGTGYSAFLFEKDLTSEANRTLETEIGFYVHPAYDVVSQFEFLDDTERFEIHLEQESSGGLGIHMRHLDDTHTVDKQEYDVKYQYTLLVEDVAAEDIAEVKSRLKTYTMNVTGAISSTNLGVQQYIEFTGIDGANPIKTEPAEKTVQDKTNVYITVQNSFTISLNYKPNMEPTNMTQYNAMVTALGEAKAKITLTAEISRNQTPQRN